MDLYSQLIADFDGVNGTCIKKAHFMVTKMFFMSNKNSTRKCVEEGRKNSKCDVKMTHFMDVKHS